MRILEDRFLDLVQSRGLLNVIVPNGLASVTDLDRGCFAANVCGTDRIIVIEREEICFSEGIQEQLHFFGCYLPLVLSFCNSSSLPIVLDASIPANSDVNRTVGVLEANRLDVRDLRERHWRCLDMQPEFDNSLDQNVCWRSIYLERPVAIMLRCSFSGFSQQCWAGRCHHADDASALVNL